VHVLNISLKMLVSPSSAAFDRHFIAEDGDESRARPLFDVFSAQRV